MFVEQQIDLVDNRAFYRSRDISRDIFIYSFPFFSDTADFIYFSSERTHSIFEKNHSKRKTFSLFLWHWFDIYISRRSADFKRNGEKERNFLYSRFTSSKFFFFLRELFTRNWKESFLIYKINYLASRKIWESNNKQMCMYVY